MNDNTCKHLSIKSCFSGFWKEYFVGETAIALKPGKERNDDKWINSRSLRASDVKGPSMIIRGCFFLGGGVCLWVFFVFAIFSHFVLLQKKDSWGNQQRVNAILGHLYQDSALGNWPTGIT
jgi:hypothetical protein